MQSIVLCNTSLLSSALGRMAWSRGQKPSKFPVALGWLACSENCGRCQLLFLLTKCMLRYVREKILECAQFAISLSNELNSEV
jgi:hypothetical protein